MSDEQTPQSPNGYTVGAGYQNSPSPQMPQKKKWYENTWVIVLALILFPPLGILLAWVSDFKKPAKIAITVIGLLLILIYANMNGSLTKNTNTPATTPSTSSSSTLVDNTSGNVAAKNTSASFSLKSKTSENKRVYLDYSLGESSDSYFKAGDSANQKLAESVYDDAIVRLGNDYPGMSYLSVMAYTQTGDAAFVITRPNDIATPKVTFYKYVSRSGSTYDYDWYDNRYGNGQTW